MKAKGYISSRSLNNNRVYEQKIQNLVIRNFCESNNYHYLLGAVEYRMKNCFMILNQIISDHAQYDAIVFFSYQQLPEINKIKKLLSKIILKEKIIFFAFENITIKNKKDIDKLLTLVKIDKIIPYCIKNIN